MRHVRPTLILLAVLAVTLAGCAGGDDAASAAATTDANVGQGDRLSVVATTSIIGDIVTETVGDAAEVEVLMGPGVDPHAFSPSAAQAQLLREADLVVANGLRLEENLLDTIEAAEEDGVRVAELGPAVNPIAFEEDEEHEHEGDEGENDVANDQESLEGDEHEDDHGQYDPHVWLDAGRMAEAVGVITDALAEVDDALSDDEWASLGEPYAEQLRALDDELQQTLSVIPDERRQLVSNHEAFGYWADAYDFEIVGTVIPGDTTQLDASAADFAALVQTIEATGVPAIFSESTSSVRLAEAVAEEVGREIEIVQLYTGALDEPGSDAGSYFGLMRTNARLMVDALAD